MVRTRFEHLMHPGAVPIVPEALGPGARIAVVAPSSPFDKDLVLRGVGFLGERYQVEHDPGLFAREGYLAGSDDRRLAELDRALKDPGIAAIVTARGGYGLLRIAHRADWASLRRYPKWLVGFSDATTLHLEALRAGVASLHAENAGGLARGDEGLREDFVHALEHPTDRRDHEGLVTWVPGDVTGPLVGGNLTLLASAATAGRLALPKGAVLVIEDVTEAAYRVDRLLSGLLVGGHLDAVAGVVVGDFSECPASRGVEVLDVVRERLSTLRVPVAAGLPVGHGGRNRPLVLGVEARFCASRGVLSVGR